MDLNSSTGTGVAVLDKLAASEQQRKADRAKRREDIQQHSNPQENVQEFLQDFNSKLSAITAKLDELSTQQSAGNLNETDGQSQVESMLCTLFDQDKLLAEAAYFLPSFDLRNCTLQVQEAKAKLESTRASFAPKKKFAFSRKVSRVKASELLTSTAQDSAVPTPDVSAHTRQDPDQGTSGIPQESSTLFVEPTDRDLALVAAGQGLQGLQNQTCVLHDKDLGGQDFVILKCTGCTIFLLGQMGAVRLLGLRHCTVVCGPVPGATFIDDVQHCELHLASYQVRIHRAIHTDFYIRTRSRPIIEHSTGLRFAPYIFSHDSVLALLEQHKLHEETGMHRHVDDFGWIKAVQSPNWCVMSEDQQIGPPVVQDGSK